MVEQVLSCRADPAAAARAVCSSVDVPVQSWVSAKQPQIDGIEEMSKSQANLI